MTASQDSRRLITVLLVSMVMLGIVVRNALEAGPATHVTARGPVISIFPKAFLTATALADGMSPQTVLLAVMAFMVNPVFLVLIAVYMEIAIGTLVSALARKVGGGLIVMFAMLNTYC